MTTEPRSEIEDSQKAYLILLGGGLLGALGFVGFFISAWWWWTPLVTWLREGTTEELWQFLVAEVVLFVGLGGMFAAFQSARRFERIDPTLRRVLYGYNAFLQLFLVGKGLALLIVFFHIRYPLPFDTTEGGFYSLGAKTKQYIAALDRPVEVYMVMDVREPAYANMLTVLTEMQSANPRYFHFEDIPLMNANATRLQDLNKRFKQLTRPGIIVAYGDKPENNATFIASGELSNEDYSRGEQSPRRDFNGEVRLMQELMFLSENKKKPIVYITQGHGEPSMQDRGEKGGLTRLVQLLTQGNFDVRPLTAISPDPKKNSVPSDADVVMVIGPQRSMSDIIPALGTWMNPTEPGAHKGRLVAMLGPTQGIEDRPGNPMADTGMEEFLRNFGVTATKEQILMLAYGSGGNLYVEDDPVNVVVDLFNPDEARNPLALVVKGHSAQRWRDVRRLEPLPAAGSFQAEAVMGSKCLAWTETDMKISVHATMERLRRDKTEAEQRIKGEMMPVLLAVTESPANPDPHSMRQPSEGRTPRLVVFGCSSIATDPYMRDSSGPNFELIRGSIDWTREHYTNIGVEPKSYRFFRLPVLTSFWNLFYLPVAALLLTVAGLGLIVWNVRRS